MPSKMKLMISEDDPDVGYLKLPAHPGAGTTGAVKKTIRLSDLIENYKGADINLDFDDAGELIGVEILV